MTLSVDITNAYPEWIEGAKARAEGKPKSANPYPSFPDESLGMAELWGSGWEAEKDAAGSRFWCDKCRKPIGDATSCGNCGQYGST